MNNTFFSSWQFWILLLISVVIVRTWFVFKTIQRHRASLENRPASVAPIKTLVVLGSGGHTTEMLALLENVDSSVYTPLVYIVASTDDTSLRRVQANNTARRADQIYTLPRSREVGQSYTSSIFTTTVVLCYCSLLCSQSFDPTCYSAMDPERVYQSRLLLCATVFLDSVEATLSFANPFVESKGIYTCLFDDMRV